MKRRDELVGEITGYLTSLQLILVVGKRPGTTDAGKKALLDAAKLIEAHQSRKESELYALLAVEKAAEMIQ